MTITLSFPVSTRAGRCRWASDLVLVFLISGIMSLSACTLPEVKMGRQHAANERWDDAVAAYRQAVRKDPFDSSIPLLLEEAKARAAKQHFQEGRLLLKDRRYSDALNELKLALAMDPSVPEHEMVAGDAMRLKEAQDQYQVAEKLQRLGHVNEALEAYEKAVTLNPSLVPALEAITTLTGLQRGERPAAGFDQPITLRFQNTRLKEVFEILARTADVNIIVDKDVRDDPITIFVKETPLEQVLSLILNTNNLVSRQLASDTFVILPNSKQKLDQYQDLMVRTFYLSTAKAKDLVNMLRAMLETKRIFVNEQLNTIVMRDRPEKLQLAERMILANDRPEPEVQFDVEILEVNRTKFLQYGVNFSKQARGQVLGPVLKALGPQSILLLMNNSFTLDFLKTEADARTLAAPKIRVLNNRQAKIIVGDKQPILLSTSNVLPGGGFAGPTPTTSTVTSIEFKDVGVKVTVEPTIHLTNEITLKLQVEVTRVGEQVELQSSPRIAQFKFGTRAAETILNLKDNDTVVLGGLIQDEDRKQRSTVPLLGDIPFIGQLFSSDQKNTSSTEVVLTITPHIVQQPSIPELETQRFWSGTESAYGTQPLFAFSPKKRTLKVPLDSKAPSRPTEPEAPGDKALEAPALPAQEQLGALSRSEREGVPDAGSGVVARLSLRPVEFQTTTGEEFRLDIAVDDLESLTKSVVTLHFNPRLMTFLGASEGELLTRDGVRASVIVKPGSTPGNLELHLQRYGPPVSGQGSLVSIQFKAKGAGVSPVEIHDVNIAGANAKAIAAVAARGVVLVR